MAAYPAVVNVLHNQHTWPSAGIVNGLRDRAGRAYYKHHIQAKPSMTVTVTNMHHSGVYMTRRPANRQAWRRGVLVVLGGALVAFVLYWAAAGVLGDDNAQE
jgi:hypothetical protein